MYMFTSTVLSFNIRSCEELWGFEIDVVDSNGEALKSYYLHQQYNQVDDSPDSAWQLKRQGDGHFDEPLLRGRLVYGRTDPFTPLIKCLQFLNEQEGTI